MISDIQKMIVEEKMHAKELLWDDFCGNAPDFQSPNWHEAVLKEREKRIMEGKDMFVSWVDAKNELQELIS
jgi:hypothetical protein